MLSTSGHVVAMVNPPGEDKANFKANSSNPPKAEAWLRDATTQEGSWWPDWTEWLGERSGKRSTPRPRPAPGPTSRCSARHRAVREGRGLKKLPKAGGVYYERRGQGEPLLLISGFAIPGAVFEPVLAPYEERFNCILYDHPGAGRSRTPLRPISIPELAADAVRVLDELGYESAHVMGVSMGGMVAQEMAIRFPHRVRGLVLGCTTPGGPRAVRPALGELGSLALGAVSALREEGRPWLAAALFSERFRREHPERVRELLSYFFRHRARPHGVAWHWWASVYHDTVSRLHRIQAPTLVFQGEDDLLSPWPTRSSWPPASRRRAGGGEGSGPRLRAGAARRVLRAVSQVVRARQPDRRRAPARRPGRPGGAGHPGLRAAGGRAAHRSQPGLGRRTAADKALISAAKRIGSSA